MSGELGSNKIRRSGSVAGFRRIWPNHRSWARKIKVEKRLSTAATAYFFLGDLTDVGGGEFEYAAEVTGLGGIEFLAEGWEKWEKVQTPSAFVTHEGVHPFGFGFYG